MNELNSDAVLWLSLAALIFSVVSFFLFGWKMMRSMEGLDLEEDGSDTVLAEGAKPSSAEADSAKSKDNE